MRQKGYYFRTVGYYCRFSLSYRNVSEILKERGVSVHLTTIMRWVHPYRPELNERIRKHLKRKNDSGRVPKNQRRKHVLIQCCRFRRKHP